MSTPQQVERSPGSPQTHPTILVHHSGVEGYPHMDNLDAGTAAGASGSGGNESEVPDGARFVPSASGNDSQVGWRPRVVLSRVEELKRLSLFFGIRVPWDVVAMKFDNLAVDGCLRRSKFGKCIGNN